MIGKLSGVIDSIFQDSAIIDVGGVGYVVNCSSRTLRALPMIGERAQLTIETHVREDSISLYGFIDNAERDWFRMLGTVKGVGSRIALAILGSLKPDQLATIIISKDKSAFKPISGVGPKIAERIILELQDKAGNTLPSTETVLISSDSSALADAVSALTNLGYMRSMAYEAANQVLQTTPDAGIGEIIKLSLKRLSK